MLVEYNGHIIYRVHIESHNKIIQVQDLSVYEDNKAKASIDLPKYKDPPTF